MYTTTFRPTIRSTMHCVRYRHGLNSNCSRSQRICTFVILALIVFCHPHTFSDASALPDDGTAIPLICEYYNKDLCMSGNTAACNGTEVCSVAEEGKRSHCYALWDNAEEVRMKGCWLDLHQCYDYVECVVQEVVDERMFCCCEGPFCNSRLVIPPILPTPVNRGGVVPAAGVSTVATGTDRRLVMDTILITLLPLLSLAVIIVILFIIYRKCKLYIQLRHGAHLHAEDPEQLLPNVEPLCIEKLKVKAHGRFGSVYKAHMFKPGDDNPHVVAVKVFPPQDRSSWAKESEFYNSVDPHPNILRFIRAESRICESELWLVTEYHKQGSLYDYLKTHSVDTSLLIHIALTMFRGLSYLHSVSPECSPNKPPLAHRDLKSRNVLIKADMSACIADFGLFLMLGPGMNSFQNQVGTRRYMSPEVLDGSVNFTVDSFLKIDMYASALILWELLYRWRLDEDISKIAEYEMPFEREVGPKPSLETMQECVVMKRIRPEIKQKWLHHEILGVVCNTMEECWDQDPEARLSSECVEARLGLLCSRSVMPSTESSLCTLLSRSYTDKHSANTTLTTSSCSSTAVS